jgi:sec-independent protein translocase protein TatB
VVLLFLETIGTSELLLILVAALVVFGPRRLPELGRKLGKSMAEFRRVSDDFKRTWEREVDLDRYERERTAERAALPDEPPPAALADPAAREPVIAESHNSIARGPRPAPAAAAYASHAEPDAGTDGGGANVAATTAVNTDPVEQSPRKSDWL